MMRDVTKCNLCGLCNAHKHDCKALPINGGYQPRYFVLEQAIEAIEKEANGPIGDAPCSGAFNLGLRAAANIVRELIGS